MYMDNSFNKLWLYSEIYRRNTALGHWTQFLYHEVVAIDADD